MYFAVTVFHKKGKNKVRLVENTKMKALILKEIQKLNLTKTKKSVNRHAEISTETDTLCLSNICERKN